MYINNNLLIQKVKNRLLRDIPACRKVKIVDSDIFIVSYPRSGNTWIRFLLGKIILKKDIDFINKEEIIPDIYKNSNKKLLKISSPRFLKSHEYFDSRYPKVIYIYRDGRDVAVSYYKWFQKFNSNKITFDKFLGGFLKGTIDNYGNWAAHIKGWMDNCNKITGGILFLKYEELKKNLKNELKKILIFLGVERSEEEIIEAIEWASFEHMAFMEKRQESESDELRHSSKDIKFVGEGGYINSKRKFTIEQKNLFKKYFGEAIITLGYEKDNRW